MVPADIGTRSRPLQGSRHTRPARRVTRTKQSWREHFNWCRSKHARAETSALTRRLSRLPRGSDTSINSSSRVHPLARADPMAEWSSLRAATRRFYPHLLYNSIWNLVFLWERRRWGMFTSYLRNLSNVNLLTPVFHRSGYKVIEIMSQEEITFLTHR